MIVHHHVRLTPYNFAAIAPSVASVYVDCFAQEPWCEIFEPSEVLATFQRMLAIKDVVFLVAQANEGHILGATISFPLEHHKEVTRALINRGRAAAGATMYCSELFVSPKHQARGVGGRLFDTATGIAMGMGYAHRVLRTSAEHERLLRFYAARGYVAVTNMTCSSRKRHQDGQIGIESDVRTVLEQLDS
jgi:GNAT superfamily N-acetyltransferase